MRESLDNLRLRPDHDQSTGKVEECAFPARVIRSRILRNRRHDWPADFARVRVATKAVA